jgi:uncharacterized membrane protein
MRATISGTAPTLSGPVAQAVRPVAALLTEALSRVVGHAAMAALAAAGADAPCLYVGVMALAAAVRARQWVEVAADLELVVAALGVTMSPDERSALATAVADRMTTAVLTDPAPREISHPESS